jgi:ribosomal protein S18 acetylase RimI-like enzyme
VTPEAITIRRGTPEDYAGICAVMDESDAFHRGRLPWLFIEPGAPSRPTEYFDDFFRGERAVILVADAGEIVGVATGLLRENPSFPVFRPATYVELDGIAVSAKWRRHSIGTRLARGVESWAADRGAEWIQLGVYEFNDDARRFYDSLGYETLMRRMRRPLIP